MQTPARFAACVLTLVGLCAPLSASIEAGATDLGAGWISSPWFGSCYEAGSGWVYEGHWGWLYEADGGGSSTWLYASGENGWYWTDSNCYPWLYSYGSASWVWFWTDTIDPRLYYDSGRSGWTASDGSDGAVWHRYYAAIVDAETADYREICHILTAVNPYNKSLPWDDSHTRITVASWMGPKYIASYVVGEELTPSWKIWVTVSGEASEFARGTGLSGEALTFRMKELIGLPPDADEEYWVEFSVRPEDLFRPSADPDPSDSEAELDFPSAPELSVSAAYREWFAGNEQASYVLARWGYPWTRLGYTYNWSEDGGKVGLSEFIIRPGAKVVVTRVATNEEYLEGAPQ